MPNKLRNLFLASLLLALAPLAHAQVTAAPDPINIGISPEVPGPGQQVTITVQGVGSFLGDADISWTLNGTVAKQGTGESSFSFTTGALGAQSVVKLKIVSSEQGTITRTFVFNPSTVDLIWEADTSVPPLYRGHTRYTPGSNLRVVAFPTIVVSGKKVAPQSLSYQWQVNDAPMPAASGLGRSTLSFSGDQLEDGEDVAVDVYFGSLKAAHGEVVIPASNPSLVLYDQDPLRGVLWDTALPGSIALNATELTVLAQPYFFANGAVSNDTLQWNWTLNGGSITGPDTSRGLLTLRQTGQGQGSADLAVSAQNLSSDQLIQSAQAALSIVFGQARSGLSSFFGI